MLLAQGCTHEEQLRLERRNALTVMRIQQSLQQNPQAPIYLEELLKAKSSGMHALNYMKANPKHAKWRLFILNRDNLSWYRSFEDYVAKKFVGRVKLAFIFQVAKLPNRKDHLKWCLELSVSMYRNRKREKCGSRSVVVSFESEPESDKWVAAIEYLKMRAILTEYAKKNSLVNFIGEETRQKEVEADQNTQGKFQNPHENFGRNFRIDVGSFARDASVNSIKKQKMPSSFKKYSFNRDKQDVGSDNVSSNCVDDLSAKLRLLYQISMTSFLDQVGGTLRDERVRLVTREQSELSQTKKPPQLQSWNINNAIKAELGLEISESERMRTSVGSRRMSMRQSIVARLS